VLDEEFEQVNKNNCGSDTPVRIAINGFGRIGRSVLRLALERSDLRVVAVNDLAEPAVVAHQLQYDSTLGRFQGELALTGDLLQVAGGKIRLLSIEDPAALPWAEEGVDLVIEATGRFTSRAKASAHLDAGARKVMISAPSLDADIMMMLGINHEDYLPSRHHVISNASCTTNCLAPLVKVLDEAFGIEKALFTTVHPYTNNQKLHDSPHGDLRRGRAGGGSMIPTTTTAVAALHHVMPRFLGRLDGMAIRVPTAAVANIDFSAELSTRVTADEVNRAFARAAAGELAGILDYSVEPLISHDFRGSRYSTIFDAPLTQVVDGNMVRVFAWYDNETGYSSRLLDMLSRL
jgi:glyceraldehyde 3-phosphate dehydrogenase